MSSQLSDKTRAMMREAMDIHAGRKPNRVSVTPSAQEKVLTLPEIGRKTEELVSAGKLVADPVNVKNARYSTKPAKDLLLFHYDFVPLHVGKIINFVGQYQAARVNPDEFPLYRLVFPAPVFRSGNGGMMDVSLLATRNTTIGKVFVNLFIEQSTFTHRYSKKERDEHRRKTNQVLKDQFWRVKRWDLSLPDYNKFALFLPSGLDYALMPFVCPDGVVEIRKTEPDDATVALGYKTLVDGHAVNLM